MMSDILFFSQGLQRLTLALDKHLTLALDYLVNISVSITWKSCSNEYHHVINSDKITVALSLLIHYNFDSVSSQDIASYYI